MPMLNLVNAFKKAIPNWDPAKHPRDRMGQFIEVGDFVHAFKDKDALEPEAAGRVKASYFAPDGRMFIGVESYGYTRWYRPKQLEHIKVKASLKNDTSGGAHEKTPDLPIPSVDEQYDEIFWEDDEPFGKTKEAEFFADPENQPDGTLKKDELDPEFLEVIGLAGSKPTPSSVPQPYEVKIPAGKTPDDMLRMIATSYGNKVIAGTIGPFDYSDDGTAAWYADFEDMLADPDFKSASNKLSKLMTAAKLGGKQRKRYNSILAHKFQDQQVMEIVPDPEPAPDPTPEENLKSLAKGIELEDWELQLMESADDELVTVQEAVEDPGYPIAPPGSDTPEDVNPGGFGPSELEFPLDDYAVWVDPNAPSVISDDASKVEYWADHIHSPNGKQNVIELAGGESLIHPGEKADEAVAMAAKQALYNNYMNGGAVTKADLEQAGVHLLGNDLIGDELGDDEDFGELPIPEILPETLSMYLDKYRGMYKVDPEAVLSVANGSAPPDLFSKYEVASAKQVLAEHYWADQDTMPQNFATAIKLDAVSNAELNAVGAYYHDESPAQYLQGAADIDADGVVVTPADQTPDPEPDVPNAPATLDQPGLDWAVWNAVADGLPSNAVIYKHPQGSYLVSFPSSGTVVKYKPDGKKAATSATYAKLVNGGHGQWQTLGTGPEALLHDLDNSSPTAPISGLNKKAHDQFLADYTATLQGGDPHDVKFVEQVAAGDIGIATPEQIAAAKKAIAAFAPAKPSIDKSQDEVLKLLKTSMQNKGLLDTGADVDFQLMTDAESYDTALPVLNALMTKAKLGGKQRKRYKDALAAKYGQGPATIPTGKGKNLGGPDSWGSVMPSNGVPATPVGVTGPTKGNALVNPPSVGPGVAKASIQEQLSTRLRGKVRMEQLTAAVLQSRYNWDTNVKDLAKAAESGKPPSGWVLVKSNQGNWSLQGAHYYGGKEKIAAPTKADFERAMLETVANSLIQQWAGTSNDHNARALAMQLAAVEEFGLKDTYEWPMATSLKSDTDWELNKHRELYRTFLREMYNNTQEWAKKNGVKTVRLRRGSGTWAGPVGSTANAKLRPMSSFSTNYDTAAGFGTHRIEAYVPIEWVIGNAATGYGCQSEYEWVVLGGVHKVKVIK